MNKQQSALKKQHPDKVVLFSFQTFLEAFGDDAETVVKVCRTARTVRHNVKEKTDTVMTGFPTRLLDKMLEQLVRAGHTVVLAEQIHGGKYQHFATVGQAEVVS